MPHASLKLVPGVDQNRTPTLNEAAISTSQLVRFVPDKGGIGLVQKLGGWTKFYGNQIESIVRSLWGWADLQQKNYLAVGAEQSLNVIESGSLSNITPHTDTRNPAVSLSTTAGSNEIVVTDTGSNITSYDTVFFVTQVSIGGLVLFGLYPCKQLSSNQYYIYAKDVFGNPLPATSTVTNGGAVPAFNTTSGSAVITVDLNDHGLNVGDAFSVLVSTTVGGIPLYGNYVVTTVISPNSFTIQAANSATSSAGPISENSGNARYIYYISVGPLSVGSGYGIGGYGMGGYGTGVTLTPNPGTSITASDWSLSNWGQILIANPKGGAIYQWDPSNNLPLASVIAEAPAFNNGSFVAMPQRQIIAYGSTFDGIIDPLLVRWCDIENFFVWAATSTNQAGSYRIPRGSKIVGGLQGPQQGLLWTDLAVWAMQYISQPYVYGFNELGSGCGLIAQKAAGVMNNVVYWMSQSQFFQIGNGGITPIFCPIWDVIFQDLDTNNLDKIRIATNSRFGEVAWYYPTKSNGGEVSHYVKYNVNLQQWDFGQLPRTAWIDQSVLGPPIGADANKYIYQHETSTDADGTPMVSNFTTGYFAINEANEKQFVDQIWPDMKWGYYNGVQSANVQMTFYVTDYPGQAPLVYGPYTLTQATQYITPRFRARLMAIQLQSSDIGSFWRIGNIRYRTQPDGKY